LVINMNKQFNISEAFVIAVQLEKNGAAFYKEVASSVSDSAAREFLEELAAQEYEHEKVFEELAATFTEDVELDELSETYIKALSTEFVFTLEGKEKNWAEVNFLSAVDFAIEREKDSIIFFLGISGALDGEEYQKINQIVSEEKSHLIDLLRLKARSR
jgi:rubrerythrin